MPDHIPAAHVRSACKPVLSIMASLIGFPLHVRPATGINKYRLGLKYSASLDQCDQNEYRQTYSWLRRVSRCEYIRSHACLFFALLGVADAGCWDSRVLPIFS